MMYLSELTVEYRVNPIGIDEKKPRFSWKLNSELNDTLQSAYHIKVYDGVEMVWDSLRVDSEQSVLVSYEGDSLKASTLYEVEVTVWDNYGNVSKINGTFETGLLAGINFSANWITHTLGEVDACPLFMKNIEINKPIKKARIYSTALGVYEIHINNQKVGDEFFAPGWTNYKKRLQYQTYDVTQLLQESNELNIIVGNGWYKGVLGFMNQPNLYGDRVAVLAELHIWYEDESKEVVRTDLSWGCKTGTIRSSEIYNGEMIDSTFESYDVLPVEAFEYDKNRLVAQECEPVRITKRFRGKELIRTPKGEMVIDFGQNMSGFVTFKINGFKGQKIVIKHAEVLDKEGNFYTENLREAKATDTFICKGGNETFMPHFTFHGFRYICIEGIDEDINLDDFIACAIHTDMQQTGSFNCSNQMVNQLQNNIEWGQRGNFLDVPTDCPQRDERLGWTGDAQVFCRTAGFNMNTALFFTKWLRDLASEQTLEFGVTDVVPDILGQKDGCAAWGDAATIIPWTIYEIYGDKKLLENQYQSMKDWVEFIRFKAGDNYLWQNGFQYGDWLGLDKEEMSDRTGATDVYLVASAYYAHSTQLLCKAAKVLNKESDFVEYSELYQKIKVAFNEEYVTKTGRLVSETQTACVLALYFDLVEPEYRERIFNTLEKNLAVHKNHLVTGFVGTPYISHLLSEMGRHDLAGILLLNEDYPSWLYAVKLGATTIWERWNSMKLDGSFDESGMNSFNHYAYGAIGDWMYQKLAGIQLMAPGYKKIKIAPQFIKGITSASANLETVYGQVSCNWSCIDKKITMDVEIPANTTAIIQLPEQEEIIEVGSGKYHYEYSTETVLELDRFSMNSTLGFILEQPLAIELLERYVPGTTTNPMIKMAYHLSLSELCSNMPAGGEEVFKLVVSELNQADVVA